MLMPTIRRPIVTVRDDGQLQPTGCLCGKPIDPELQDWNGIFYCSKGCQERGEAIFAEDLQRQQDRV
jgi:hypothetical protein